MTFILRWPVVLVLLAAMLVSLAAAFAATVLLVPLPVDLATVLTPDQIAMISAADWLETGLWYGAALFFLISSIRLMRRTQGFWTWLLGFACYGGRWAVAQQDTGGLQTTVQSLTVDSFQPQTLIASTDQPPAQIALLGVLLIVGLIIFIIDAADRSYWDRQEA